MANGLKISRLFLVGGNAMRLPVISSDPGSASNGDMYYNDVTNEVKVYINSTWVALSSGSSSAFNVDKITLSGTDITNGYVTLSGTPLTASKTILDVIGGVQQEYSVDFTVTGNQLSWSGLGLDGVLTAGDKLTVQYD